MTDEQTSMHPLLADLAAYARRAKERAVRTGHNGGEMTSVVDFERAGQRICRIATAKVDPDEVLTLVWNGVPVTAADAVTCAMDAYGSPRRANPVTGKQWEFGDMDSIANHDAGIERGLLYEGIAINRFERAGPREGLTGTLDYTRRGPRRDRIEWTDHNWVANAEIEDMAAGTDHNSGRFPRVAREAFERTTLMAMAVEAYGGVVPAGESAAKSQRCVDVSFCLLAAAQGAQVIEGAKGRPLMGFDEVLARMT